MSSPGGQAAAQPAIVRASAALQDFQQQQQRQNHSSAGPSINASFFLTQRGGVQGVESPSRLPRRDGLTAATKAQLPRWYVVLRQSLQDAWRVVCLVYKLANHVLGSLFEVRFMAYCPRVLAGCRLPAALYTPCLVRSGTRHGAANIVDDPALR